MLLVGHTHPAPVHADAVSVHGSAQENSPHIQQKQQRPQTTTAAGAAGSVATGQISSQTLSAMPTFVRGTGFRQRAAKRPMPAPTPKTQYSVQLNALNQKIQTSEPASGRPERPKSGNNKRGTAAIAADFVAPKPREPPEPLIRPRTPPPRARKPHAMHAYTSHAPETIPRNRPLLEHVQQTPGTSYHVEDTPLCGDSLNVMQEACSGAICQHPMAREYFPDLKLMMNY